MSAPPRTLVVVCDDWPVRAAGVTTDAPAAVWSHRGILATNAAARAAGVRRGLRRRSAQGRCPELRLIAHDPIRDARCFEPVVAALGTFSPLVEILEPGTCAMATRGPSRYFGGDTALAEGAIARLTGVLGDPPGVRVGVADGPLIARLAAHAAAPGAALVVPPGAAASFVAAIPLASLAPFVPDPDVLATWEQLGITTLDGVAALGAPAVLGRFGPDGIWVHHLARGVDPTTLVHTPVPPELSETVDFDPPEMRSEAVAFAVRTAAEAFVTRLADRGLSCARVVLTLATDHAEEHRRHWRLDGPANPAGRPRARAALIAERVRWQTDGWLAGPPDARPSAGIVRVVLAPGAVVPARGVQLGFWGGVSAADDAAAHAVARLEALVGPDAVCALEARGGRHPGSEVAPVPTATLDLAARSRPGRDRATQMPPWPGRLPAPSPTLVCEEPLPIEVLDGSGRSVEVTGRGEIHRTPVKIRVPAGGVTGLSGRGSTAQIMSWAGPWPVSERWWDPATGQRQARLQVVTADGTALLVARRHRRWWLHAVYA